MTIMTAQQFIAHWMGCGTDGEPSRLYELEEYVAESDAQYRSECAMFGDAGPGQGSNLARAEVKLASVKARLVKLGALRG